METPGINTVSANGKVYEVVATYSTKAMGTLWNKRGKMMSKAQAAILKGLYDAKKGKYCSDMVMGTPIIYRHSITNEMGRLGYGRYYSTPQGFECLEGILRGTLLRKTHTNVDIKNCHSTIIYQYAKNHFNMSMPHLEYYAKNTDEIRTTLMRECGLTKQQVKDLFTITLYNGYTKVHCHAPLTIEDGVVSHHIVSDIKKEISAFTTLLKAEECHAPLLKAVREQNKKNIDGCFVSYVIQREERLILDAMVAQIQVDNFKIDSLDYDGFTARGKVDSVYLRNCEKAVKAGLNYDIILVEKEFEFIPDSEMNDDKENMEYLAMKEEFEKTHAYYRPGNAIVEMGKSGLRTFSLEHANEAFNHLLVDDEKQPLFITHWRKDPKRRIVENLVMKEEVDDDEFSVFRGLYHKTLQLEVDVADRQMYEAHFLDLMKAVCGDDDTTFQYVLRWFANMIQNPLSAPVGTALMFYSRVQGTGKDTLLKIIMSVIGHLHSAHHSGTSFWEKHSTKSSSAIFEYVEDVGLDYLTEKNIGSFRNLLTSPLRTYNPKGEKPFDVDNKIHHAFSTNFVFKLDDTDRRIFPISASTRLVHQDWTKVYELINRPEYIQTIGQMLETLPLAQWKVRPLPETALRTNIKEVSLSSEQRFIETLENGSVHRCEDMYRLYCEWCIINVLPYCRTSRSFSMKLLPYYGSHLVKTRDQTGMVYEVRRHG